jgi:hypothetical protein
MKQIDKIKDVIYKVASITAQFVTNKVSRGQREYVYDECYQDIEKLLSQTRKECYDEMREMINTNQKGTFTDDGGNDCWYIDSLNKALDEKEGK